MAMRTGSQNGARIHKGKNAAEGNSGVVDGPNAELTVVKVRDLSRSTWQSNQLMDGRALVDVVVSQRSVVIKLLSGEDQPMRAGACGGGTWCAACCGSGSHSLSPYAFSQAGNGLVGAHRDCRCAPVRP